MRREHYNRFMKKITDKINTQAVMSTAKYTIGLLVAGAAVYALAIAPIMDKRERIACHIETAAAAQQLGENIASQNQDNEELTQEEINQQINVLVNQQYEAGYVLCLRNKGL